MERESLDQGLGRHTTVHNPNNYRPPSPEASQRSTVPSQVPEARLFMPGMAIGHPPLLIGENLRDHASPAGLADEFLTTGSAP